MKIDFKMQPFVIWKKEIEQINEDFNYYKLTYVKEESWFDNFWHYYFTRDFIYLNKDEYVNYVSTLEYFHKSILDKIVNHVYENNNLEYFGFSKKEIEVLKFDYKNLMEKHWRLIGTYFWRYDLLIDKNNDVKIVEFNSETPAWMPESIHSFDCYTQNLKEWVRENFIDPNQFIEKWIASELEEVFKQKQKILIVFGKWEEVEEVDVYHEDYLNALQIAALVKRNFSDKEIEVKVSPIDDIEMREDWIYVFDWFKNEMVKQDLIWSFYPLEWIFKDKGWEQFWDLYLNKHFDLVNKPINLITQNKFFWSYIFDKWFYDNSNGLIKQTIDALIPKSHKVLPNWVDRSKFIRKAVLYREWVGIDVEDNHIDEDVLFVYQEKIEQKPFYINTFYSNKETYKNNFEENEDWVQKWYVTLGFYFWDKWFIWPYNRFCENIITDDTCYSLPLFIKK